MLLCVKSAVRLKKISESVQLYGTSSSLFDLTTRDRGFVKAFLYPNCEELAKTSDPSEIHEKISELPFPLLHPKGKFMFFWSPVVVLLMIYTAIFMPFLLVFYENDDNWQDPWYVVQNLVDILFWMDLVVNMFSCFYDEEGVLITDRKKVMVNYAKTWFFVDLLACIPFDLIENPESGQIDAKKIQLVRLSRLPRLYRIVKIAKIFKFFQFGANKSQFFEIFELNSGFFIELQRFLEVFRRRRHETCEFAGNCDADGAFDGVFVVL